ncbi:hypothetical protein KM043_008325 [Ampulex compressa]|nr:hypothetical protein KM043_008325 [Ampulex compressa]
MKDTETARYKYAKYERRVPLANRSRRKDKGCSSAAERKILYRRAPRGRAESRYLIPEWRRLIYGWVLREPGAPNANTSVAKPQGSLHSRGQVRRRYKWIVPQKLVALSRQHKVPKNDLSVIMPAEKSSYYSQASVSRRPCSLPKINEPQDEIRLLAADYLGAYEGVMPTRSAALRFERFFLPSGNIPREISLLSDGRCSEKSLRYSMVFRTWNRL